MGMASIEHNSVEVLVLSRGSGEAIEYITGPQGCKGPQKAGGMVALGRAKILLLLAHTQKIAKKQNWIWIVTIASCKKLRASSVRPRCLGVISGHIGTIIGHLLTH